MSDGTVIPLNDLKRLPTPLAESCREAARKAIDTAWYLLGPETAAFEASWALYVGVKHAVSCANGTDALELMLNACSIGPADEVILAPNAGFYGSVACMKTGATPVYADIEPDRPVLSLDAARHAISKRTKAILITHLYGMTADAEGFAKLCDEHGLMLLEDCAQAHGASLPLASSGSRKAGATGHAASFSFYPTKNLGAFGDAGAVVTNHDAIASRLRQLRQYGWSERYVSSLPNGRNSRMDEVQAAVLRVMLPMLDERNEARRHVVKAYRKVLGDRIYDSAADGAVAHLAVARFEHRDVVARELTKKGIGHGIHYPVLDPDQPAISSIPHRVADDLSNARAAVREIMTLPCFPDLTAEEITTVLDALAAL